MIPKIQVSKSERVSCFSFNCGWVEWTRSGEPLCIWYAGYLFFGITLLSLKYSVPKRLFYAYCIVVALGVNCSLTKLHVWWQCRRLYSWFDLSCLEVVILKLWCLGCVNARPKEEEWNEWLVAINVCCDEGLCSCGQMVNTDKCFHLLSFPNPCLSDSSQFLTCCPSGYTDTRRCLC